MAVVRSSVTVLSARKGGRLVEVAVPGGRGVSVKMYEDEARARGLMPDEPKKRTPTENE